MRWMIWKSNGTEKRGKGKASRRVRRRPSPPRWLRPTLIAVLVVSVLGSTIGVPVWLWQTGWIAKTTTALWRGVIEQSVEMGFSVEDVRLEGRRHSSKIELIEVLGLRRGDPILTFDIAAARQRLLALPWVREASVNRRLPNMIQVSIKERQPMALWQRKGRLVLVDTYGVVVTGHKLGRFRNLIIIVGKDASRHAATLFAMLDSEPLLARQVTAAVRIGDRRWNVQMKPGIRIQLPETDPHLAWQRLARMNQKHKLLSRDVKTIDLRFPDKLIVEPGALGSQLKGIKGPTGRNT
ncbi:MAG: FtsQ-type POTRA domain-containing protein [Proteobacteria bacterium]|nr:FtsQ-type POTRA domain-containing protein [Pseudomonadota bacterium]